MSDTDTAAGGYQVLARKYRPQTFADLIGQEAMVRTLENAFASGRVAHAFVLTGVRGVGKTTTARIIARGLNCIGPDGTGGPTTTPCGICAPCVSIAAGRNVDVLEMDAASRTGVGDIREIIDSVPYRASTARYKVYIIDEVHMLSTSAFNALLKTLEEPPPHVKFLFATTEIRKVPVTVLSRCQRFDLRRIEPEVMAAHLGRIATAEGVTVEDAAMALLVRAAEGSVRDALSLLDQAIAHGEGAVTADRLRAMLGLADRGRMLDLFEAVMRGDVAAALDGLAEAYRDGADGGAVLRDLAEITHWVSLLKVAPAAAAEPGLSPDQRARGEGLAAGLSVRVLSRAWQMLLKALEELSAAPNQRMAAEMALIRLTHVADLPAPEDLVRRLTGEAGGGAGRGPAAVGADRGAAPPGVNASRPGADGDPAGPAPRGPDRPAAPPTGPAAHLSVARAPVARIEAGAAAGDPQPAASRATAAAMAPDNDPLPDSFADLLALIRARRDLALLYEVERGVRLVRYQPGRIEFQLAETGAPDLAARLSQRLQQWTGRRWGVSVVGAGGGPTVAETRDAGLSALDRAVRAHPLVRAALEVFPEAELQIRPRGDMLEATGPGAAQPAGPEDFDPFEEESD